jgi:hypothetical protein
MMNCVTGTSLNAAAIDKDGPRENILTVYECATRPASPAAYIEERFLASLGMTAFVQEGLTLSKPESMGHRNVLRVYECASRLLLRRYQVELRGPFLIKQCAFGLVATAPMFVAAGDEYIFARPDTLFAGIILV